MSKKTKEGKCSQRNMVTREDQLCDFFETKRKNKYQVRCKNCVFYELLCGKEQETPPV